MTSGTVSSLFFLLLSCSRALAQQQAQFNQVLNIDADVSTSLSLSLSCLNRARVLMSLDATELLPIPGWIESGNVFAEAATVNR